MSVRIVIDGRAIGSSSGRYIAKLVDQLGRQSGNDHHYLLLVRPADRALGQKLVRKNVELVLVDIDDFSWAEQLRLPRVLKKLKPDLVHFCFPQHPVLWRGAFVLTIHDLTMLRFRRPDTVSRIKQQVFRGVINWGLRAAEHIIVPTDYVRQDLIDSLGANPDKVSRIYEAADRLAGQPQPIPKLDGLDFVLSVGNGLAHKNNRRLVAAQQQLLVKHPRLHLVLAGRVTPEVETAVSGARQVITTGKISDSELVWAYRQARGLIMASLSEGFGLPGLEAWQFDLPVLASQTTCLPEVYGSAAGYFDPEDVSSMATTIDRLLSDRTWQKQLVAGGQKRRQDFDWANTARQTTTVYRRVLTAG